MSKRFLHNKSGNYKRISSNKATRKSNYHGGFVFITGKAGFGPVGKIGNKSKPYKERLCDINRIRHGKKGNKERS